MRTIAIHQTCHVHPSPKSLQSTSEQPEQLPLFTTLLFSAFDLSMSEALTSKLPLIPSFQKFNPNMTPMNISFFEGGCIPSLGTRKHLIACNLELVQVHRNTWAVSWACKLHLLGGGAIERIEDVNILWYISIYIYKYIYTSTYIYIYRLSEYIHLGETSRNV